VQAKLHYMTNIAKEMFDVMEEDEDNKERLQGSTIGDILHKSYSDSKVYCPSPDTPASLPPELNFAIKFSDFADVSRSQPLLLPLRLQSVGSLMPTDMKSLSFKMSPSVSAQGSSPKKGKNKAATDQMKEVAEESQDGVSHEMPNHSKAAESWPEMSNIRPEARGSAAIPPPPPPPTPLSNSPPTFLLSPSTPPSNLAATPPPPPPPIPTSKGSVPLPPPPMSLEKGAAAPPPPPPGVIKALRPKKATTKLKRSTHMGNMYRVLKRKVEGSSLKDKATKGTKTHIGGSAGGKKGMADALAEMTKRSSFSTTPNCKCNLVHW
jgi:hypothetical protein